MANNRQPSALSMTVDDVALQYLLYNGNTPAIVLQHATGFLPWLWHPIARRLCPVHQVVAPYFCDHRPSDIEKGGLSWIKLAEDLFNLCSRLNLKKPVMVGHSMGATVMTLAEALFGPFAAGLVLFEPIFLPQDYYNLNAQLEDHPLAAKSIKRRNTWKDHAEAKAYLKTKKLFRFWDEEILDLYLAHGMVEAGAGRGLELTCPPTEEAALFLGGNLYDPWPMLADISCPVLICEGENSGNSDFFKFKKVADTVPRGSYRLIREAGHLIPMEKPEETFSIISRFVRTIVTP